MTLPEGRTVAWQLPKPGRRVRTWLAARHLLQAFGTAHDPPHDGEKSKKQADHKYQGDQADQPIEKADPEGADLESVVGLDPFRRIAPVDVSDDHADEASDPDDQAGQIENIDDLRSAAFSRIAAGDGRVDLRRALTVGNKVDDGAAAR